MTREDHFTNTPEQAALAEAHRAEPDDSRPTLAEAERDEAGEMRGISPCWQNNGWHVYMAGPCFDTVEQARTYRDSLDAEGVTWRSQQ